MRRRSTILASGLLAGILVLLVAGEYTVMRHSNEFCSACHRAINPKAGVIAEIGGVRRRTCCAHCAAVEGLQRHVPVRLIEVSDYNSGQKLSAASAWYVEGSRKMACAHGMNHMDEDGRPEKLVFDRCSPGTLAFAERSEAEQFAHENGGTVRSLSELMADFGVRTATAQLDDQAPHPATVHSAQSR